MTTQLQQNSNNSNPVLPLTQQPPTNGNGADMLRFPTVTPRYQETQNQDDGGANGERTLLMSDSLSGPPQFPSSAAGNGGSRKIPEVGSPKMLPHRSRGTGTIVPSPVQSIGGPSTSRSPSPAKLYEGKKLKPRLQLPTVTPPKLPQFEDKTETMRAPKPSSWFTPKRPDQADGAIPSTFDTPRMPTIAAKDLVRTTTSSMAVQPPTSSSRGDPSSSSTASRALFAPSQKSSSLHTTDVNVLSSRHEHRKTSVDQVSDAVDQLFGAPKPLRPFHQQWVHTKSWLERQLGKPGSWIRFITHFFPGIAIHIIPTMAVTIDDPDVSALAYANLMSLLYNNGLTKKGMSGEGEDLFPPRDDVRAVERPKGMQPRDSP